MNPLAPDNLRRLNFEFNPEITLPNDFLIRLNQLKQKTFRYIGLQVLAASHSKERLQSLSSPVNEVTESLDDRSKIIFSRVLNLIQHEVQHDQSINSLLNDVVPTVLGMEKLLTRIQPKPVNDVSTLHRIVALHRDYLRRSTFGQRCVSNLSGVFIHEFVKGLSEEEKKMYSL